MTIIALLLGLGLGNVWAQDPITPAQAKDHVGQKATVCGTVASATFLETAKNSPTFLNLDAAFPKQIFTVVIWGKDRAKFGKPEADYLKKKVCATGTVVTFKDIPQIVVQSPAQLAAASGRKEAPGASPQRSAGAPEKH